MSKTFPVTCAFCRRKTPKVRPPGTSHRACAEAFGLDYDPQSDAHARDWLDRRREALGSPKRWTVGLTAFQERVLDLLVAGGKASVGNLAMRCGSSGRAGSRAGYRSAVETALQRLLSLGLAKSVPVGSGAGAGWIYEPVLR